MVAALIFTALLAEFLLYALAGVAMSWAFGMPPLAGAAIALAGMLALRIALFGGVREAYALLVLFTWGQIVQRWTAPCDPPRVERGVLPVLFVHGIYCNVGIRSILDELRDATAQARHAILFADAADAENHEGCEEMVKKAVAEGITQAMNRWNRFGLDPVEE